jgi:hypothetical protein
MNEDEIKRILENNLSKFEYYYDDEWGWIVVTTYCQLGGCVAGYIECDSEEGAKRTAAKMTLDGLKPNVNGVCQSCMNDYYKTLA